MYNLPESYHFKQNCQKCMCMMCEMWNSFCRWCSFCYVNPKTYCNFCRNFVPVGVPERIRAMYVNIDENPEKVYNRED